MFLPCPIDANMNKGVANELENNLGSSLPLMTIKASVTHLLHALMMKRNGRSNNNKWVVYFRAPIDNVLAITHKYWNSLSIKARNNYKKRGATKSKGTHKYLSKNHSESISL